MATIAGEKHPLPPPRSPWQPARQRRQPGPAAGRGRPGPGALPVSPRRPRGVPEVSPRCSRCRRPGAVRGADAPTGRERPRHPHPARHRERPGSGHPCPASSSAPEQERAGTARPSLCEAAAAALEGAPGSQDERDFTWDDEQSQEETSASGILLWSRYVGAWGLR